jgi:S-adenosylmethionine hydrolase
MRRPIVLVTDYGRDDAYAASLIGAALAVDAQALCIEGTHGVPSGDVLAGAYYLKSLALAFDNPVFCAVVDPGVGTSRRAIAVACGPLICVAPDNGLVSYLWAEASAELRRAVALETPSTASHTFHGRDVFAPAAAALAAGGELGGRGDRIDDPIILDAAFAARAGAEWIGRVVVVDHFGNAITTIRDADLGGASIAGVAWDGGSTSLVVSSYNEIPHGRLAGVIGSSGHLEVAGRGVAAQALGGPNAGAVVHVELR